MRISLQNLGKRYNREWIFRGVDHVFEEGKSYAIIGPNGSGKSTLLQVIAGAVMLSEGSVQYEINFTACPPESSYKQIAVAAPYLELIEEMTSREFLEFHAAFKPLTDPVKEILSIVGLKTAAEKQIRYYSSGMKQRLKLAQAIFSKSSVLLLDEPCTNLDAEGIALYQQLIASHANNRLVIVSSNDIQEYGFCTEHISINDYK